MKKKHNLILIDGHFTAAEAKEVLVNVFTCKIQFHQSKNFSSKERFGKEDETALKRLPELKSTLEKIRKLFSAADANNETATIKSEVSIVILKQQQQNIKKKNASVTANEKESVAGKQGEKIKKD